MVGDRQIAPPLPEDKQTRISIKDYYRPAQSSELSVSVNSHSLFSYQTRSDRTFLYSQAGIIPSTLCSLFIVDTDYQWPKILQLIKGQWTHSGLSVWGGERCSGRINGSTQPTFTQKPFCCCCKWLFSHVWVSYPLCPDDSLSLWFYHLQRMR